MDIETRDRLDAQWEDSQNREDEEEFRPYWNRSETDPPQDMWCE